MLPIRQDDLNIEDADGAFAGFLDACPTYGTTRHIDGLRANEYGRLDDHRHIYLDYTGGGLYADDQLRQHVALLAENVYSNPHSSNPTSLAMTCLVEQARDYVYEFFNASPDEYAAIFTPNASGALKLLGASQNLCLELLSFGPLACDY